MIHFKVMIYYKKTKKKLAKCREKILICISAKARHTDGGSMRKKDKRCHKKIAIKRMFFLGSVCVLAGGMFTWAAYKNASLKMTNTINIEEVKIVDEPIVYDEELEHISSDGEAAQVQIMWNEKEGENFKSLLVNYENYLETGYQPELEEIENNYMVDERIIDALKEMLQDARAEGLDPWICSAYRSEKRQTELFQLQCRKYEGMGYTKEKAKVKAATSVAEPGTSEHATGLAVDIVSRGYQILDRKQEKTKEAKWLMENCYKYGFILRYPNGKTDITGIIYEPWHYRYVGVELATYLTEQEICFEEYIESIKNIENNSERESIH